jgi:putative exosortase-associated protein (TIGR04073 family)
MVGIALVLGLLVVLGEATVAQAQEQARDRRDISLMFRKLSRGAINVLTGWVEVPKNIAERWKQTDPFSAIVWGQIEGHAWAFARTAAGVYEVVTFPFPYPADYEPLMEPEFILTTVWGEPMPFMTEPPVNPADSFYER